MGGIKRYFYITGFPVGVILISVFFILGCGNIDLFDFIQEKVNLYELSQSPGVLYVSTSGDDSNSGTKESPFASIQKAIDLGSSLYKTTEVRIAAGSYNVNYGLGTHIVLKKGASLHGGYSGDFNTRDPASYITTINDLSSSGGTDIKPICAIDAGDDLTTVSALDGLVINAGGGDYSAAVSCIRSSITIRNCVINFTNSGAPSRTIGVFCYYSGSRIEGNVIGGGEGLSDSWGVYIRNCDASLIVQGNEIDGGIGGTAVGITNRFSSPVIRYNTIRGRKTGTDFDSYGIYNEVQSNPSVYGNRIDGGTSSTTYGIYVSDSGANLINNLISGGSGTGGSSYGVYVENQNGALKVRNNTISGGSKTSSYALYIDTASGPYIENNVLFTSGGGATTQYGLYEGDNDSDPVSLRNNDFYNYTGSLKFYRDSTGTELTSIGQLNSYSNTTQDAVKPSSGNIAEDPDFADIDGSDDLIATLSDNDWHIQESSSLNVRQGGLNGSSLGWGFSTDADGLPRTNVVANGYAVLPGLAYGVAMDGSYAYVGAGTAGFFVYDISLPAEPILAGFCDTPGLALGVAVSGSYAYLADEYGGLHVIDVSDPENPFIEGSCDTPGQAYSVVVSGNYAFLTDGTAGFTVANVSNPSAPIVSANMALGGAGATGGIVLRGIFVYATGYFGSGGVAVLDVTTPSNPVLRQLVGSPANDIAISTIQPYGFKADRLTPYIWKYNFSNPIAIGSVGSPINFTSFGIPHAVAVHETDTYAYAGYDYGFVTIYTTSNPLDPTMGVTYAEPLGRVYDIAVRGDYVCTVGDLFAIYNIGADPSAPYTEGPAVSGASGWSMGAYEKDR